MFKDTHAALSTDGFSNWNNIPKNMKAIRIKGKSQDETKLASNTCNGAPSKHNAMNKACAIEKCSGILLESSIKDSADAVESTLTSHSDE